MERKWVTAKRPLKKYEEKCELKGDFFRSSRTKTAEKVPAKPARQKWNGVKSKKKIKRSSKKSNIVARNVKSTYYIKALSSHQQGITIQRTHSQTSVPEQAAARILHSFLQIQKPSC